MTNNTPHPTQDEWDREDKLLAMVEADEFEQDHSAPEFEPEDLSLSEASYFDFEYPLIGGDSDLGGEW